MDDQPDSVTIPIIFEDVITRDSEKFLQVMGKVLKMSWLRNSSNEGITSTLGKLLPSFANRCVDNDDFVSLQEILKRVDVNCGDYNGYTPMHRACEKGKLEMVKNLICRSASSHISNCFGHSPLYLAIRNRHFDVIQILKFTEATLSQQPVRIGMELIRTVQDMDFQLLHAWYLSGVSMNEADYNGRTALHVAVMLRLKTMVSKLLEYGATPLKDVWGQTAMMEAQKENLYDILKLFDLRFPK